MAHWLEMFATKTNNLSSILRTPTWQEERSNSYKLSTDIYTHTAYIYIKHSYIYIYTYIHKCNLKIRLKDSERHST